MIPANLLMIFDSRQFIDDPANLLIFNFPVLIHTHMCTRAGRVSQGEQGTHVGGNRYETHKRKRRIREQFVQERIEAELERAVS